MTITQKFEFSMGTKYELSDTYFSYEYDKLRNINEFDRNIDSSFSITKKPTFETRGTAIGQINYIFGFTFLFYDLLGASFNFMEYNVGEFRYKTETTSLEMDLYYGVNFWNEITIESPELFGLTIDLGSFQGNFRAIIHKKKVNFIYNGGLNEIKDTHVSVDDVIHEILVEGDFPEPVYQRDSYVPDPDREHQDMVLHRYNTLQFGMFKKVTVIAAMGQTIRASLKNIGPDLEGKDVYVQDYAYGVWSFTFSCPVVASDEIYLIRHYVDERLQYSNDIYDLEENKDNCVRFVVSGRLEYPHDSFGFELIKVKIFDESDLSAFFLVGVSTCVLRENKCSHMLQTGDYRTKLVTKQGSFRIRSRCPNLYYGENCEFWDCFGIRNDHNSTCSSNGSCISPNTCECTDNYDGNQCETWTCDDIDRNNETVCNVRGKCLASSNECFCESDGYYGRFCEFWKCAKIFNVISLVCSGNGECVSPDNCTCIDPFYGEICEFWDCFGIRNDNSSFCSSGSCLKPDNCTCPDGYFGTQCQTWNCSISKTPCSSNGVCLDGICFCDDGFTGRNCLEIILDDPNPDPDPDGNEQLFTDTLIVALTVAVAFFIVITVVLIVIMILVIIKIAFKNKSKLKIFNLFEDY